MLVGQGFAGMGKVVMGAGWDGMCLAWLGWAVLRVAEWCCLCIKGHHTFPDIHTPLLGRHLDRAIISANHHLRTFDVSTINMDKTDPSEMGAEECRRERAEKLVWSDLRTMLGVAGS